MVFLEQIRKTYYEDRKKGMTHNKAISTIGSDIQKYGLASIQISALTLKGAGAAGAAAIGGNGMWAACGISNALPWVLGGVMYTA